MLWRRGPSAEVRTRPPPTMRSLALTLSPSIMLPNFAAAALTKDCHGQVCHPVEEFCSTFAEACAKCETICDRDTHNFHADMCARECPEYNKYDPLKAEIHAIQSQQHVILVLLIVLLALIAIRYAYKCLRWMRHNRCVASVMKKLQPKKTTPTANGKDLCGGATTIQNVMTINDIERASSQVPSVTGAESSVQTVTTRYPAENSTPSTINHEYSYDNQGLALTPVSEKPTGSQAF